jgi:phospholipid-translocating ATPase
MGADSGNSWTALTWTVVVGSTVVMMLWIVVYSAISSGPFADEFIILYGGVTFWATLIISVFLAIGKLFVINSTSQIGE